MASISKQPNGRKTVQFIGSDRKRRSIRLGKITMSGAESVKSKVEHLVSHKLTKHALDSATSVWVSELDTKMTKKLAGVGLIDKKETMELKDLLDYFYKKHETNRKPNTLKKYTSTINYLLEYFDENTLVKNIDLDQAEEWRDWIAERCQAENTIRKHCGVASVFFNYGIEKKKITENPFSPLTSTTLANKTRDYYISIEEAERVLQACPDAEWRLIFALARFGGLRTPSETFALRWENVNWADGRFYVTSPKTEHHAGKEGRIVPIFPQLRPYLEECFEQAKPGDEHVIVRHRVKSNNLRTTFTKIIIRAGLLPWKKPFQNLRSTRETELQAEGFHLQTVVAWLGNSAEVALKSYLQVREEDYEKAVQKAVQYTSAYTRMSSQNGK